MDIRSTHAPLGQISMVLRALRLVIFTFTLFFCFSVGAASVSVAPGTTDGQVDVGPDGSVGYSIPIRVPPGTAGIEPKLVLAYNSRGGPSAYGFGWAVGGVSSVQRGPRNIPEDGSVRGVYLE